MTAQIETIKIRNDIFDFLKNHPRLKNDGEIEYPTGEGVMVPAVKVSRWEKFPFVDWLIGGTPSVHVYFERENLLRFSTSRRQNGLEMVVACVTTCSTRSCSMDGTAILAKIVQQCLEERPKVGNGYGQAKGTVPKVEFDSAPSGNDKFAIMANVQLTVNYFEETTTGR